MTLHLKRLLTTEVYHDYQPTCYAIFEDYLKRNVSRQEMTEKLVTMLERALTGLEPGETLRVVCEAWDHSQEDF